MLLLGSIVLVAGMSSAQAPPPAAEPGLRAGEAGVEDLLEALRRRTAARREAAAAAWQEHGPAYLRRPGEKTLQPLLEQAPEIQGPVLADCRAWLRGDREGASPLAALVDLLAASVNASGARQLADLIPSMPLEERVKSVRVVGARGDARCMAAVRGLLTSGETAQREAALETLLRYGELDQASQWLGANPLGGYSPTGLGAALSALGGRDLPADLVLPSSVYRLTDRAVARGLVEVLQKAPDDASEEYLLALVENLQEEQQLRRSALVALEAGAERFRWRNSERHLEALLEERPRDDLAVPAAWTLHRLGVKDGSRFLLAGPLLAVRNNPEDERARFALGRLQVDLGEHSDAYRNYKTGIDSTIGTLREGRISSKEWFQAARAAAGARRLKDAGEWLERARMSPTELSRYRDLPEFAGLLGRQPFKRLFGIR